MRGTGTLAFQRGTGEYGKATLSYAHFSGTKRRIEKCRGSFFSCHSSHSPYPAIAAVIEAWAAFVGAAAVALVFPYAAALGVVVVAVESAVVTVVGVVRQEFATVATMPYYPETAYSDQIVVLIQELLRRG